MHADELKIDRDLVRALVRRQAPHWADLPLEQLASPGTTNAIFRLGSDLVVRLPRIPSAVEQARKEQAWLPRLAPHLPLAVPTLEAVGEPDDGFPWPWSVYRWIAGTTADDGPPLPSRVAEALAEFVVALRAQDASDGPAPGDHNSWRGEPLVERDAAVRAAIEELREDFDAARVTAARVSRAWEASLAAPVWDGPPTWLHGDLLPTNLVVTGGELRGVLDFGLLGVGDPACDLMAGWACFDREARTRFRECVGANDAAWLRGRGWALSFALIALPYYRTTNPVLAAIARRTVLEVLGETADGA